MTFSHLALTKLLSPGFCHLCRILNSLQIKRKRVLLNHFSNENNSLKKKKKHVWRIHASFKIISNLRTTMIYRFLHGEVYALKLCWTISGTSVDFWLKISFGIMKSLEHISSKKHDVVVNYLSIRHYIRNLIFLFEWAESFIFC